MHKEGPERPLLAKLLLHNYETLPNEKYDPKSYDLLEKSADQIHAQCIQAFIEGGNSMQTLKRIPCLALCLTLYPVVAMSTDDWPKTPPIIVFNNPSQREQYREELENTRKSVEEKRENTEKSRSDGTIDQKEYKREMEIYKTKVNEYNDAMRSYKNSSK